MDTNGTGGDPSEPAAKRRRIPKACTACQKAKVRCDEQKPCARCIRTVTTCTWHEKIQDPVEQRFERIESSLQAIAHRLDQREAPASGAPGLVSPVPSAADSQNARRENDVIQTSPGPSRLPRELQTSQATARYETAKTAIDHSRHTDVVSSGLVTDADATCWFRTFFEGCDRFVPIFDPTYDNYASVKHRSSVLFDVIVIYGCRAALGSLSKAYQQLHLHVRKLISELALGRVEPSQETIQALLVLASYSESGAVLCDLALRTALEQDLPAKAEKLLLSQAGLRAQQLEPGDFLAYTSCRIYYGIYVLDQILSLDGGKPPSVRLQSPAQRVRALLKHTYRTPLDLRLYAQVELNTLRASSYEAVDASIIRGGEALKNAIAGGLLDLDLWLADWTSLVIQHVPAEEAHETTYLNVRIQHAWAVLALNLRALTSCGIENIALMTDVERSIAVAAKEAAEHHLELLLTSTATSPGWTDNGRQESIKKPYVANFRYAMEFVWAKNAFCVLIVLRLGLLLGDHITAINHRLQQSREFLGELEKVGMGANISYTRILSQTVQKCQKAVTAHMRAESARPSRETSQDNDFQSYIPKEFLFEWDFPGLHLCYIPLDWQDLFLDFGP